MSTLCWRATPGGWAAPGPASSHASTIGGVIANQRRHRTVHCPERRVSHGDRADIRNAVGPAIDTSALDAESAFAAAELQLAEGLLELRRELLADPSLADRTRDKFKDPEQARLSAPSCFGMATQITPRWSWSWRR